jgi:hypothetical protein
MDTLPDNYAPADLTSPGLPQNGRVNFIERRSAGGESPLGVAYNGFQFPQKAEPEFSEDMLRGNFEETPLSRLYFSPENIDIIQNQIRYTVYQRSGNKWVIDPQSVDELKIVMRAQYFLYGRNLSTQITEQIAELNKRVVDWVTPKVFMEIKQHMYYLNDISKMPTPLPHPTSMSSAGTRTPQNPNYFDVIPDIEPGVAIPINPLADRLAFMSN